jgi:hypothetical protein
MKKTFAFVSVCFLVCVIFASCERKSGHYALSVEAKSVEIVVMPNILDNNLLRPLDGTANIQNSMEMVAYPWHTGWKAKYEKLEMAKNPGLPSTEQQVIAYKVENAKTIKDVFYSLPVGNEWKWLTQSQIVEFCLSNRNFIKNSEQDIVFFCKKDEQKILYERNLTEELVAVIVKPFLGGDDTRMMLGMMCYDSPYRSCIVIIPQNKIQVKNF